MRHLIDPMDLSLEEIDQLLQVGDDIIKNPQKYSEVCNQAPAPDSALNLP